MFKKRNTRFFEIAKSISELSKFPRIHIGCIVVNKNKVISSGYNKRKTDPIQKQYNQYLDYQQTLATNFIHAEVDAMKSVKYMDLAQASIYIYRKDNNGKMAMCRPCNACMQMIKDLGIKHIFYTTEEGYAYEYIQE